MKNFLFRTLMTCSTVLMPAAAILAQDASSAKDSSLPVEKLFLHFDKPYYTTGDTMWFKAYLFEAAFLNASDKSGLFYLEIADERNRLVQRVMLPLKFGLGWGQLTLTELCYPAGEYTLRAYTSLMRNYGEEAVFAKRFFVNQSYQQSWTVNSKVNLAKEAGTDQVKMNLQFASLDKKPVASRTIRVNILEGKKAIFSGQVPTTPQGTLDINFPLPEKTNTAQLTLEAAVSGNDAQSIKMPFSINRPTQTDLQFLPEGGYLVSGLPATVAFKALGEDGNSVAAEGLIVNSKKQFVVGFKTSHKGMGSFVFTPQSGEKYTALLTIMGSAELLQKSLTSTQTGAFPAGVVLKEVPLPEAQTSGCALLVNNPLQGDSIAVTTVATADLQGQPFFLMAKTRGVVCYKRKIVFAGGAVTSTIPKDIFPGGIVQIYLADANQKPLYERITYTDPQDQLAFQVNTVTGNACEPGDSVALQLSVTDKSGQPVQGAFSLAVTDDGQVDQDSLTNNAMPHYLLLTSDLKGTVEEPGFYNQRTPAAWQGLNLLMLTQGWRAYATLQGKPVFAPEPEFTITGSVKGVLGSREGISVSLFSNDPLITANAITDKSGRFAFKDLPVIDTIVYKLQPVNRKGNNTTVELQVDEFREPVFSATARFIKPWFLDADTSMLRAIRSRVERQAEADLASGKAQGNMLAAVTVTAKGTVKGSRNLNGPGQADQVLTEEEMINAKKTPLITLLTERVKGFRSGFFGRSDSLMYLVGHKRLRLYIDGMNVDQIIEREDIATKDGNYRYYKEILDQFTAEDIFGIEYMHNMKYIAKYNQFYTNQGPADLESTIAAGNLAYIEITTRSGKGPFVKKGSSMVKPLHFVLPRLFYQPKYLSKDNSGKPLPDLRTTLLWDPNVVTDKTGKATVSLVAGDKPTSYTVVIAGSDMNGLIGHEWKRKAIRVQKKESI